MKSRVITKEIILKSAFELVEEKGIDYLNARSLAKKINCSTQPLYLSFRNMEELNACLVEKCNQYIGEYINSRLNHGGSFFMESLTAYIEFAYEHPRIFELIYMKTPYKNSDLDQQYVKSMVEKIMHLGGYSYEVAHKFYLQAFVYAHGFASQIATGYIKWDIDEMKELLFEEFEALKFIYREEKHGSDKNR